MPLTVSDGSVVKEAACPGVNRRARSQFRFLAKLFRFRFEFLILEASLVFIVAPHVMRNASPTYDDGGQDSGRS